MKIVGSHELQVTWSQLFNLEHKLMVQEMLTFRFHVCRGIQVVFGIFTSKQIL